MVSKRKIIFFNSEQDKQNSDPTLILDLNKVKCQITRPSPIADKSPFRCSMCGLSPREMLSEQMLKKFLGFSRYLIPPPFHGLKLKLILQVLYAGEGESRKPDENATPPVLGEIGDRDKVTTIIMKGHEFVAISFHMPASCESCTKPLWAPFRPPPAVECRSKLIVCQVIRVS